MRTRPENGLGAAGGATRVPSTTSGGGAGVSAEAEGAAKGGSGTVESGAEIDGSSAAGTGGNFAFFPTRAQEPATRRLAIRANATAPGGESLFTRRLA